MFDISLDDHEIITGLSGVTVSGEQVRDIFGSFGFGGSEHLSHIKGLVIFTSQLIINNPKASVVININDFIIPSCLRCIEAINIFKKLYKQNGRGLSWTCKKNV